jgi:hypothetical protein
MEKGITNWQDLDSGFPDLGRRIKDIHRPAYFVTAKHVCASTDAVLRHGIRKLGKRPVYTNMRSVVSNYRARERSWRRKTALSEASQASSSNP